ncbi:hypothetical protein K491DRAFT_715814 [Lophiostoma macrostomum CBS 122681]|uniref:Uncharacterized protein n=1 Tax=Lophiostoma macrostomum CBS 122681 TaxID=1314788 RepID=A0A6A6TAP0_9PLEO|nr:hypothetical protein K491DRAFT_715814 [Lophiostoma macrostomum CBS 122681]
MSTAESSKSSDPSTSKQPDPNQSKSPKPSQVKSSTPNIPDPTCVFRDSEYAKTGWPQWWFPQPGEACIGDTAVQQKGAVCDRCARRIMRALDLTAAKADPTRGEQWFIREYRLYDQTFEEIKVRDGDKIIDIYPVARSKE